MTDDWRENKDYQGQKKFSKMSVRAGKLAEKAAKLLGMEEDMGSDQS